MAWRRLKIIEGLAISSASESGLSMQKRSTEDENPKPVMSYGRPGQVRHGHSTSSILAATSLILTALAYAFWLAASNAWLMYGEPQRQTSLLWGSLFSLLAAEVSSVVSHK